MKLTQLKPTKLNESSANDAGYGTTQDIRASVYPKLEHEVAKLNRRADKLNVPHIEIRKNKEFTKSEKAKNGTKRDVKYYEVTIDGEAPQVPGYEFLATIEHKDGGNVIRTVPGKGNATDFKDFHSASPDYCDHCKKRRRRIDTFIIRDTDGNMRQIGRNCLADFLGGKDPKQMLFWFSLKGRVDDLVGRLSGDEDEEGGYGGWKSEYTVKPEHVLRAAGSLIKKYGYRKASGNDNYGGQDSTADMVRAVFFNYDPKHNPDHKDYLRVVKDTKEAGEAYRDEALAWFNTVPDEEKDRNNFLHNLDVVTKSSSLSYRDVGIAGALFPAFERGKGNAKKKDDEAKKSNEYIGEIKDKINKTKVKVVKTTDIENRFAYNAPDNQLVIMEDKDGNQFKWFNNRSKGDMEEGVYYNIMGKVTSHDEYRGRKSTRLTYVHFEEA